MGLSAAVPFSPSAHRAGLGALAFSYALLSVVVIQGFHVLEHIVVVVQVEALGMSVVRAQGIAGSQVDFEWLHLAYNASFLLAVIAVAAYVWLRRGLGVARWVTFAMVGAVALQTYHVAEHIGRVVQYVQSGCTPCEGWIGQVVLFIWPHLFFGLFSYAVFVAAYLAAGLHRPVLQAIAGRPPRLPEEAAAG